MRCVLVLLTLVVLGIGSMLWAGGGTGLGDRAVIGPCVCDLAIDVDPVDGLCDFCGGCIPVGDGPYGPQGPNGPNGPKDPKGPKGPR